MVKAVFAAVVAAAAMAFAGPASATGVYIFKLTGVITQGSGGDGSLHVGDTVTMRAAIPADLVVAWGDTGDMVTAGIANHDFSQLGTGAAWGVSAGGYSWGVRDDEVDGYDEFFYDNSLITPLRLAGPSIAFSGDKIISVGAEVPFIPTFSSRPELVLLGPTPQGNIEDLPPFHCCTSYFSDIPINPGFSIHDTSLYGNTSVVQSFSGTWDYADSSVMLVGIPEPATWGMMIVGTFALGAALRGSRSRRRALV